MVGFWKEPWRLDAARGAQSPTWSWEVLLGFTQNPFRPWAFVDSPLSYLLDDGIDEAKAGKHPPSCLHGELFPVGPHSKKLGPQE